MASRSKGRRRRMKKSPIIITVLILLAAIAILFAGCESDVLDKLGIPTLGTEAGSTEETAAAQVGDDDTDKPREEVSFHIIDVGQGDAILITTESGNMLIDSGDLGSKPRAALTAYLSKHNIKSFEYVVFTHTDADHIGSGDYVLENYDVKNVIMPDYTTTTQVFNRLVDAIEKKNVNLILIGEDRDACEQYGYTFKLGPITNTVMGPTKDFKDANEMSVVIKAVYDDISVLLTGDAEHKSEEAMLGIYKEGELDCDILKVGHHGSNTSTTDEFLDAVSPEVAVISCGQGNKFGHPHKATTDKLFEAEVHTYRTDLNGFVVIKTDGLSFSISTEK